MLTIKVEASPGAHISDAFKEAIALADKLDCFVEFKFNDVTCIANPGGSYEKGEEAYSDSVTSGRSYKFAMS